MDRATLLAHGAHWGSEDKPSRADLPRLTADERALHDNLRDNRIRKGLRLEQERISYGWVQRHLQGAWFACNSTKFWIRLSSPGAACR